MILNNALIKIFLNNLMEWLKVFCIQVNVQITIVIMLKRKKRIIIKLTIKFPKINIIIIKSIAKIKKIRKNNLNRFPKIQKLKLKNQKNNNRKINLKKFLSKIKEELRMKIPHRNVKKIRKKINKLKNTMEDQRPPIFITMKNIKKSMIKMINN